MEEEKKILTEYAKKLKKANLVSEGCNKGSISMRINKDTFLVTPSKLDFEMLTWEEINVMNVSGEVLEKNAPISRDTYFHVAIYQGRDDAKAIIHTHSEYATSLALANIAIPLITVGMKYHFNGNVNVAPFYMPDNPKFNQVIIDNMANRKAVLLKNHGTICIGENIKDAYENTSYLESISKSYVNALALGKIDSIENEIESEFDKIKGGK
jgi:L-fuculose-phosphate aldolase